MLGSNGRKFLATALVCFGLLVYEILSTRLLSVVLGGHIVMFAIALAMLGMGAATSAMSLSKWPEPGSDKSRPLSWSATILGLSYLLSLLLLTLISVYANSVIENAMDVGGLTSLVESLRDSMFYRMVWVGAILFIPYFVFGIFISILFKSASEGQYHKLYAADLIGAAAGCILAILALAYFGYAACLGLILLSTFVGAAAFSDTRMRYGAIANICLAAASLIIVMNANIAAYLEPQPSINQMSRNYDKAYEVEEKWHVWTAHSRVGLLSMRHRQSGDALSVYAHGNGRGWAGLPYQSTNPLSSLVTMFAPKRILVLFAGVGADLAELDQHCGGACEITGVEINRQMVDHALAGGAPGLGQLLSKPGIELHVAEAREYLERDLSRYDAILLSWWGAGASNYVGTAGKLAQYLYTKEAFESLLDHLTPGGSLVIYNGSKAQALTIFRQIFEDRNLGHLGNRVLVVKGKTDAAKPSSEIGFYDLLEDMRMVIKPSGFDERDMNAIRSTTAAIGARIILSPDWVDPRYRVYREIANGADIDAINDTLIRENHVELSVVTDDRPFFNDLVPRSFYLDIGKWFDPEAGQVIWKMTRALFYFVLFLSGVACVLILGPLFLKSGPNFSGRNITELFYFLSLGSGFILVEVGLVRKLGLVLGHPSYSISIVLASLILSTGIGSLSSQWLFRSNILTAKRTAALVVLYILCGTVLYDPLAGSIIALPIAVKAALIVVALFPLGFLMGQLFPQGLVRASREDGRLVPWAWAINGTASTIFVGVGYLLSYPLGFNMLLYIGAACYAAIVLLPLTKSSRQPAIAAAETAA